MKLDTLYNEDCLKTMSHMDDNSIHMIITSPPYNVNMPYGKYNDDKTTDEYLDWLNTIWKECKRILVDGGRIAINIADTGRKPYLPLSTYVTNQLLKLNFLMRGTIIWDKGRSANIGTAWGSWMSASNPTLRDVEEPILVFSKNQYGRDGKGKTSTITSDEFARYTRNHWHIAAINNKVRNHPAAFPLDLPSRLIKLYTFVDDTVYDPFMGSGTTARAAYILRRHYIGSEIDETYYNFAVQDVKKIPNTKLTHFKLDSFNGANNA